MIGYYVHHHGMGHVHRATALGARLGTDVTMLSSRPSPPGWSGTWIELARDDEDPFASDATAYGRLHWVPERCAGLRTRMAAIARWIDEARPDLMIVDVSVEVALLARLHGVPVVTTVLPGAREDPAHRLVHDVARRIVAPWPGELRGALTGVEGPRLVHVGGLSRFDGRPVTARPSGVRPSVAVLVGQGGSDVTPHDIERARAATPDWDWTVVGPGSWVDDPWDVLTAADVVVAHAGLGSIGEIAAARRPAIVIPQARPFGEQRAMVAALRQDGRLPVVALDDFPASGWPALLSRAAELDGDRWSLWSDGSGADRAARLIRDEAAA